MKVIECAHIIDEYNEIDALENKVPVKLRLCDNCASDARYQLWVKQNEAMKESGADVQTVNFVGKKLDTSV